MYPQPCSHTNYRGLCPDCQESWEEDPGAYLEFGDHPEGRANWRRLEEEIATAAAAGELGPHETGEHIPF